MKKSVYLLALGGLAATAAGAQEVGRVISSIPVIQQVAVPRQVCSQQPVVVQQQPSGAGALMGAIAGGAMGNAIGDGTGRAVATAIGVLGGAVLGNRVEGTGSEVHNYQQCSTQTYYENRAVAYNVTYEYAGRQYTVQMPQDPGPTVQLQVTPVGAAAPQQPAYSAPAPLTQAPPAPATIIREVVTVPAPVVYQHAYYPRPYYYPPVGISLNLGYHRGHRHHRHWRH
ncbi:glycine zipper 2TM domain-containing protein [Ramlibacter tataouinensis]|uniref:Glycine zipper 2TM domain-containing protein n=1 Tax=Ramlibacter tataouinensis (strain ATCC BAA-407 / DSM 14655 / LMG 21543 / TTB310) TaxID=365046 RepID=F5Y0C7_RAMTT|nr:glycine zipper 2TM domain-containing protein [Ramlibacter tataouinensis]AEG92149.1 conserved hypothetical protein [Ramlibacter tataouinensis TTB310]